MSFFSHQQIDIKVDSHHLTPGPVKNAMSPEAGLWEKPFQKICKPCKKPKKPNCWQRERTSVFAPDFVKGSLSVEAAIVLSLLFFFMLTCYSLFSALQFQMRVQYVMDRELRISAVQNESESMAYFRIWNALRKEGANAPALLTVDGGIFVRVKNESSDYGDVRLCAEASYDLAPKIQIFGRLRRNCRQSASRRLWNGQEKLPGEDEDGEAEGDAYVYITRYGEVYHRSRSCSYLNPAPQKIAADEVDEKRDTKGAKYRPCSYCIRKKETYEVLYITPQSNHYHSKITCGALRRWIIKVRLSAVLDRRPCSKCGKG